MHKKKITILNFDISDNSLGRAYILGQALRDNYDVKILGPAIKGEVWRPLKHSDIEVIKLPYGRIPFLFLKLPSILRTIDGSLIYAVKPRFTSFGFALIKKFLVKTPIILDIDDWEVGFYLKKGFFSRLLKSINFSNPNGFFWTWLLQIFIPYADKITTVSKFLQDKYGGEIIPHAKDTDFLNPECFEKEQLRKQFNLEGKKIVMFLGTPRMHKGVEDLINAVLMIEDPDLIVMVIGGNPSENYERKLQNLGGKRLIMTGQIPYQELPRYLASADVVVIPQRQTTDTVGQVPSKIFDAMAMAKPIISTRVSDIPEVLEDCGIIVSPGNVQEISNAVKWLINNPEKASTMGLKAREKCIKHYSLQILKEKLNRMAGVLI